MNPKGKESKYMKKTMLKKFVVIMAVTSLVLMTAVVASANPTATSLADHSATFIAMFQGIASDLVPIILGVIGAAIVIFAIQLGIRVGIKTLKSVT